MKTHNSTPQRFFIICLLSFLALAIKTNGQPFTKKFIMAFHTCGTGCVGFGDHLTNLAESDDGSTWTVVPNFTPFKGSVPDLIVRGNKLYIFNPGSVRRFNKETNTWDASGTMVSIKDSIGGRVNFVDPSPYLDSLGRIVLVYLNSSGLPMGQDPAGCSTYPCYKYFDSATEVEGSDGTQFIQNSGHRVIQNLESGTASDPDIYYDGSQYILYVSKGNNVVAYKGSSLTSSFTLMPNLNAGLLTNQGGIPSGHYDATSSSYWTFVHANVSGNTVIRRGIHANFSSQISSFTTVISGPIIGKPTNTTTESPGFCTNDFLLSHISPLNSDLLKIYPNPSKGVVYVDLRSYNFDQVEITICNNLGQKVHQSSIGQEKFKQLNFRNLPFGVYYAKLKIDDTFTISKKLLISK